MNPFKFNTRAYVESQCGSDDIRVQRVLPLIGKAGNVLDIGCLDGTIAMLIRNMGNAVCGIDASTPAVTKARASGIDARIGNLEEGIDFPDGTFDLVFAGEILEHVFDIDCLLDEIHRVLKPDGVLVATTPNLAAFGRRLLLLLNRNPNIEISFTGNAAGHIRYFIKQTLFELLGSHGFRVTHFTSDVINFNRAGTIRSLAFAHMFPTLGRSLIVKARKFDT